MPIGEAGELTEAVGRGTNGARARSAEAGVHILLAGHFHRTYRRSGAQDGEECRRRALVIQAGTATSTRLRDDELQSFNLDPRPPQQRDRRCR